MSDVMLEYQKRIQVFLDASLNNLDVPERLRAAMRYSTLSGGKRFRALLVYASGLAVGAPLARLDTVAAALECIHAYSLIHDDIPAMDDDDLRRGQPTSHIKYDEATAILAGDALQTLAFEMIASASSDLSDAQARSIGLKLAISSGQIGMVGGQILDIQATHCQLNRDALENVHRRKTGALINAAVICGALCSDDTSELQLSSLSDYADNLGLAFQVVDDILDIESSTQELGKPSGSDVENGKATYPALIGLQESKKLAQTLYQESIVSIAAISDNTSLLEDLAQLVVKRTK
ncbi:MAG: polyprenyl synthetase family protein [Arenicella sp.]|nr:polyprenyl synthetase family protein [Arenicella sp.]